MRAVVTLTPAESKRLIARGTCQLDIVALARREGTIIVANGVTNSYVVEELTGETFADRTLFAAGLVTDGVACQSPPDRRLEPVVLERGERAAVPWREALARFGPRDAFIKGANALDRDGLVGVLLANLKGGTIGEAIGPLAARGANLVVPIGLEKLVPSVRAAAEALGIQRQERSLGLKVGMMVVSGARVVTEITALGILAGVRVVHVASGGVGGSEGAVTLAIEGDAAAVERALDIVLDVKGEPVPQAPKRDCPCERACEWGTRPAAGPGEEV